MPDTIIPKSFISNILVLNKIWRGEVTNIVNIVMSNKIPVENYYLFVFCYNFCQVRDYCYIKLAKKLSMSLFIGP